MTSGCVQGISPDGGNPQCFRTGGHRKAVILYMKRKKRTTQQERRSKARLAVPLPLGMGVWRPQPVRAAKLKHPCVVR